MLTKTILVASALAGASAANTAAVPSAADMAAKKAARSQNTKAANKVATSSVGTSAAVTTGAWSFAVVNSCASPSAQPNVDGYNLGVCVQDGSSSSYMVASCEFNSDSTSLAVIENSYATADCTGTASPSTSTYGGLVNGCGASWLGEAQYYCSADNGYASFNSPQHMGYWNDLTCSGQEYEWWIYSYASCDISSSCIVYGSYDSSKGVCNDPDDDVCFHVDTKIDYKGVEYTYEELKAGKEPECTVPHTPASKGVVITTSCDKTVRVTDTHLMATTKGFQLAYSLKAGDVLYGDYGKDMCTVKAVEKEKTTQQYFGLNCVHSEVLASGLRASTFGDFHTLPSWYMTYVGGLVGSETASSLGEYIAEWYFQK